MAAETSGGENKRQGCSEEKKPPKRCAFKVGTLKSREHPTLKETLNRLESGTTQYRLRNYATSTDVIRKTGDIVIDSIDAPLTIMRGPWNSITRFLGLDQTHFNFPFVASTHLPVTANSLIVAIIYPLLQLQLTVEDLRDERFNKSPEELFKRFFLKNPEHSLRLINERLKEIYQRDTALHAKYKSLELKYDVTAEGTVNEKLEFYICLTRKIERIKPAKKTRWEKIIGFFQHQVRNFLSALDDAFYLPALFYWLAWAMFAIVLLNRYDFVIPGNFLFSVIVAIVIPLGFVGLLFGKRIFLWIDNHFDFPKSGFWNKNIKPCVDHPEDSKNGFWPNWPKLPAESATPTIRQKLFRLGLHAIRIFTFLVALPLPVVLIFLYSYGVIPSMTFWLTCAPGLFLAINFLVVLCSPPYGIRNLIAPSAFEENHSAWWEKLRLAAKSTLQKSRWVAFLFVMPLLAIAMPLIAIGAIYTSGDRIKTGRILFAVTSAVLGILSLILYATPLLAAYEWTHILLPIIGILLILPGFCWFISNACGVSGKNDKNVYYLSRIPDEEDRKDIYKNSCIFLNLGNNLSKKKLYYIDQDGTVEQLQSVEVPSNIQKELFSCYTQNLYKPIPLPKATRKWANQQIATNKGYYAKKANSKKAERFSTPVRELAILHQYDHAAAAQNQANSPRAAFEDLPNVYSPEEEKVEANPQNDVLTSWCPLPQRVEILSIELVRHFWMTFVNRTLRFEYAFWFILVVLVYTTLIPSSVADGFLDGTNNINIFAPGPLQIVACSAVLILTFSFLYTLWKTFSCYRKEKNDYAKQQNGPDLYVIDDLNVEEDLGKYAGGYVFNKHTQSIFYIPSNEYDFVLMSRAGAPNPDSFSRNAYVYNQIDRKFYYINKSNYDDNPTVCTELTETGNGTFDTLTTEFKIDQAHFDGKERQPEFLINGLSPAQLERFNELTGPQMTKDQIFVGKIQPGLARDIPSSDIALKDWMTPEDQQKLFPLLWNNIAENKSHRNLPILQTQRTLQQITALKDSVKKENTELAWLKLKLREANIPHPSDPDIPDATVLTNLTRLERKKRYSSVSLKFFRNPYWVSLAFIGLYWINSLFPARIFFLGGTGVTTFILQMPVVEIFRFYHQEFTPMISVGFLCAYLIAHALMGIYKKRQEDRDALKKEQRKHASLQKECLEKQTNILKRHNQYLRTLLEQQALRPAEAVNQIPSSHELYPESALYDSSRKKIGFQKFIYFFAWLSLALIFAISAASTIPKFVDLFSFSTAAIICASIVIIADLALFIQIWRKNHLFIKKERQIRIALLAGLTISFSLLCFCYAFSLESLPFLCIIPALFTGVFFTISPDYNISVFLAEKKGDIEVALSPATTTDLLFLGKDKELILHTITRLLLAMNPHGSGKKVDATQWGEGENKEKQMFCAFSQLERFKEKIKAEEPVSLEMRKELQKTIQYYVKCPEQKKLINDNSERVFHNAESTDRKQFVETFSFVFLIVVACATVYLPAAFLDFSEPLQWLFGLLPALLSVPRIIVERFVPSQQYNLVVMSEPLTSNNVQKYSKNTFFLARDPEDEKKTNLYYHAQKATEFTDLKAYGDLEDFEKTWTNICQIYPEVTTEEMHLIKDISHNDLKDILAHDKEEQPGEIKSINIALLLNPLTPNNIHKIPPNTLIVAPDKEDPFTKRFYYVNPIDPATFLTCCENISLDQLNRLQASLEFKLQNPAIQHVKKNISCEKLFAIFPDAAKKSNFSRTTITKNQIFLGAVLFH